MLDSYQWEFGKKTLVAGSVSTLTSKKQSIHVKIELPYKITLSLQIQRPVSNEQTCSWLLKCAIKYFMEECVSRNINVNLGLISNMVAFQTQDHNADVDYLLSRPEQPLSFLPERIILVPYYKEYNRNFSLEYKISLQDFDFIAKIKGNGGQAGSMYLARLKLDGKYYIVKQLPKTGLLSEDHQRILMEKNIMIETESSFTTRLLFAFQTADFCYFVMEYSPYENLLGFKNQYGKLDEQSGTFFIASVLAALEVLHSRSVIHGDLKPENVLIDIDGTIKLSNFRHSKKVERHQSVGQTISGSLNFMSPEKLTGKVHDFTSDYYSLGMLTYEILTGKLPFKSNSMAKTIVKISHEKLDYPEHLSKNAIDFIERLVCKDPKLRMGRKKGISEIWKHPWLKAIDPEKIRRKEIRLEMNLESILVLPSRYEKAPENIEETSNWALGIPAQKDSVNFSLFDFRSSETWSAILRSFEASKVSELTSQVLDKGKTTIPTEDYMEEMEEFDSGTHNAFISRLSTASEIKKIPF